MLYTHIHADVSRNIMTTSMNERTHIIKNIPHTLYSWNGCERVNVGYVWEMSWRRGQTATYWPKVLLATIAAPFPLLGWAARPWVTEGPSPLSAAGFQFGILSPTESNCDRNWVTVCCTWLYNCLMSTCFLWAYASAPNSTTSTGQGDIPISSIGPPVSLIYTGPSLDWRLGRGSIDYWEEFWRLEEIFFDLILIIVMFL